ncbi:DUF4395 domain-containing protein [Tamlana sp. 2201CG12-4]|uniref:DUF4395 domain-containing protein n=1 Tax=Tamlana sp. 2201CG12-4 TaxID=3112582 RepID=UPI002DB85B95|nr:DUF4395 domain-containing protein [Tamlana sp. 2201CG12-4]MEC3908532.1 DUF4395 domain-containing protein [Tamlana sp. 2201CG12-4]
MKTSQKRINRIKAQGYFDCTNSEISKLAFGNRFAYILCTIIVITGVATANIPILLSMFLVAFLSILLPNHPFDYIYNYLLRKLMDKPKLPPRSKQLKFACSIASIFLAATVSLFYLNHMIAGYIVGTLLIISASLVAGLDICIPSIIYNAIYKIKPNS